jgi:1,6-anhydro-N-acetylmuramate kinase
MASKYPVIAMLERARRYGSRIPFEPPEGYRSSLSPIPPTWVMDSATNMIMPPEKFEELAQERRRYAAELKAQHLAAARAVVRDLEPEQKRLTTELASCAAELAAAVKTDPGDHAAIVAAARSVMDRSNSRASVSSALAGQRFTIRELTGKATATEPDDEVSG